MITMTKTMKEVMASDLRDLGEMMGMIPEWMAERYDDLKRASEYFFSGDRCEAFKVILDKGLQEFLDMCDMDDHFSEIEDKELQGIQIPARTATVPEGPANLLDSFNKGLRGE